MDVLSGAALADVPLVVVSLAVVLYALYWVVRKAVAHGLLDADRVRQRHVDRDTRTRDLTGGPPRD